MNVGEYIKEKTLERCWETWKAEAASSLDPDAELTDDLRLRLGGCVTDTAGAWPHDEIAAASRLVLPELSKIDSYGERNWASFYRHVPRSDRERILWHAEEFARDIDRALRLRWFWPRESDHLHILRPIGLMLDDGCGDDGRAGVVVRSRRGEPIVTLYTYCDIGGEYHVKCSPECRKA